MNGDEREGDANPIFDWEKEKKKQQQRTTGTISGAHTSFPPLPYFFPIVVSHVHGKRKAKGGERRSL